MKTNIEQRLQLSLLGFTTLTFKLVSLNNIGLLAKTFHFINNLFMQSSLEVKQAIIESYLQPLLNFLLDCENRDHVVALFPSWMRNECRKMMNSTPLPMLEMEFVLHLN